MTMGGSSGSTSGKGRQDGDGEGLHAVAIATIVAQSNTRQIILTITDTPLYR